MNKEKITELLDNIDIDIDLSEVKTIDELDELVTEHITGQEVIYYANAIKYLAENDPSLNESLELASQMGYETKDLNSELLATILLQENMNADYTEIREQIKELLKV
jgi:hypothetical protein